MKSEEQQGLSEDGRISYASPQTSTLSSQV